MPEKLIFVVEDEENVRRLLEHCLKRKWSYQLRLFTSGEECLAALDERPDLIILDIMMPGISGIDTLREIKRREPNLPVIILSSQVRIEVAVETIKLGALDYLPKTVDMPKLEVSVKNALQLHDLTREVHMLRETVERVTHFDNIITSSGSMEGVLRLIHKAKDSDISVLVQGESGTGKELVARAIHFNGKRKGGPFVAINCAAIPGDLLESEMFGHERGAFTGAQQRKIGKMEQAHGGTIFLDEMGELDINLQAKLLRAIQLKQFERVGGNELITVDTRIVAATNRDLLKASHRNEFREDLYYRLCSFPIMLPPLRERRADILPLAEHFLKRFAAEHCSTAQAFSRRVIKLLYDYPWPGNVRELESAIQRATLLADGEAITEADLPMSLQGYSVGEGPLLPSPSLFDEQENVIPLEAMKEQAVKHALKVTDGNILDAARKLGISRSTLYQMMKKYEVAEPLRFTPPNGGARHLPLA